MKKKFLLLIIAFFGVSVTVNAQKGNNAIQVSGQLALPVSSLSDIAKTGFGGAVKGIYGFSENNQQFTLEAGYNRFSVKELPMEIDANYSVISILPGYRHTFGNFVLEPQVGFASNRVGVSYEGESATETKTSFAWAAGVSYLFNKVELGIKYQTSELSDSDNISFIGIRLGYNFSL